MLITVFGLVLFSQSKWIGWLNALIIDPLGGEWCMPEAKRLAQRFNDTLTGQHSSCVSGESHSRLAGLAEVCWKERGEREREREGERVRERISGVWGKVVSKKDAWRYWFRSGRRSLSLLTKSLGLHQEQCPFHWLYTYTHRHIHVHTHTLTHIQPHTNYPFFPTPSHVYLSD